ncbi:protein-methionine sulfoxide oxidase mical2b isoform X2 [Paramormyrops kingsleyae]|uniref:protein-methionine sulfoxide oxidase mical2b isoform X2 n=1 Tax=Paramormyrops kingsleyae TaxID=1676925 RepID=UPI000CD62950|nr:MICAL-like protein 2 isoform X2 [Paramormyrops kingsleyae]
MAAVKALQQWCRIQCEDYRDVSITNMTTSFRDGLAFCALIHKHRPDLINFDSLRKEDIYENNKLAFTVAQERLGIPALLDAEDMVNLKVPDRLSILTYVSQYYNYFHGRSPIGGMAGVKRPAEEPMEEPGKKCQPVIAKSFSKPATENQPPQTTTALNPSKNPPQQSFAADKKVLVESNKSGRLNSTCMVCKNHVHLVQRHLVDGKLYHRNCFKCKECSNVLLSGTYKTGTEPGTFVCITHQNPIYIKTPTVAQEKKGLVDNKVASGWSGLAKQSDHSSQQGLASTKPRNTPPAAKLWTPSAEKTQTARQKFLQSTPNTPENSKIANAGPGSVSFSLDTEKDKAKSLISKKITEGSSNNNKTFYRSGLKSPDSKTPPGSRFTNNTSVDDIPSWRRILNTPGAAGVKAGPAVQIGGSAANKEPQRLKKTTAEAPQATATVSASSKVAENSVSPLDWRSQLKPISKVSKEPRPADPEKPSSAGETKRRLPSEPSPSKLTDVMPPGPSPAPIASPPAASVNQRAPSPKPSPNGSASWGFKNGKGSSDTNTSKPEIQSPKTKTDYIPKEEILKELEEIENNLNELEKNGVELEKRLRRCEEAEDEDVMDDLMVDWFNLIRNKQVYMRRESELVYVAKTQDLEEQQPGVEGELRRLMEKPEHLKTTTDRKREAELMEKLVEIVNDRNAIIEGLDEDRLREEEEDEQLNQLMKNLDIKKPKPKKKSIFGKLFS